MNASIRTVLEPSTADETANERPDLTAWRRRHALRRSSAAQPVRSKRQYRRGSKHRKQVPDS
ncbi:hypothetical protein [Nocardia sp. NPDC050710]|uniref:hypothetical protein n=1 Tax=Nocardia sp. NPDC050710 TaxID=3157220 RepID=UPI0033ED09CF